MEEKKEVTLEKAQELMRFLQGEDVKGFTFRDKPELTPEQAFAVIYYLQEKLGVIPETYEMCDHCHELYDSDSEGTAAENGHFCYMCTEYAEGEEDMDFDTEWKPVVTINNLQIRYHEIYKYTVWTPDGRCLEDRMTREQAEKFCIETEDFV